jgi:hypothetical protein
MLGKLTAVIGLISSFALYALPNSELMSNLKGRLHPLPNHQGSLIKSFTHHTQSYIYDQALAIIAFTNERDQKNAKDLLQGLRSLQQIDGSLYFSYYLDGKSPYPEEGGDKRFAGAIAWVALAATHYQHKFNSHDFVPFNKDVLSYLKTQIAPLSVRGTHHKALRFSPTDIRATAWNESETAALEHNLDAYAAFLHFASLNKKTEWKSEIKQLKAFIMAMWDPSRSHFWSGANMKTGLINKEELYLDNQSWSLLALDKKTLGELKSHDALEMNCELFFVEHEGVKGFMDSKPASRPAKSKFVWSEGSAGQILAMKRVNKLNDRKIACQETSASDFVASMRKMKRADGGIGYATTTTNPDFTTSSSVAGTAWYYFAANDFNPFHPSEPE